MGVKVVVKLGRAAVLCIVIDRGAYMVLAVLDMICLVVTGEAVVVGVSSTVVLVVALVVVITELVKRELLRVV